MVQTCVQLQLSCKPVPADVRGREWGQGNSVGGQSPNPVFKKKFSA